MHRDEREQGDEDDQLECICWASRGARITAAAAAAADDWDAESVSNSNNRKTSGGPAALAAKILFGAVRSRYQRLCEGEDGDLAAPADLQSRRQLTLRRQAV